MKHLLLLAGQKGSGKSTVETLIRGIALGSRPFDLLSLGMADAFKQFVLDVFEFEPGQIYGPSHRREEHDPLWSSISYWYDCRHRLTEVYGWAFIDRLCEACPASPSRGSCMLAFIAWFNAEEGQAFRTKTLTARRVLQTFGTELGRRVFGADIWVDLALSKLRAEKDLTLGVITDGRFINEIAAVKAAGGKVWRIVGGTSKPAGAEAHPSEAEIETIPLTEFDEVIENPIRASDPAGSLLALKVKRALYTSFQIGEP